MPRHNGLTPGQLKLISLFDADPSISIQDAASIANLSHNYTYQVFRWIKNGRKDTISPRRPKTKDKFKIYKPQPEEKTITCLRCNKTFESEDHISNRICDRCQKVNSVFSSWI